MSAPPPSKLDFPQVLQGSFDDSTGTLRTSTTAIISPTGSVNIIIASSADSVAIGSADGSSTATLTTLTGHTGVDVNVINLPPVQAVSGSALTATIAGTANVNVTDALAISSIVPVAVSGTTAVSGTALTSVLTSPAHQVGALVSPYGYLRTSGEGSALLYDDFDSTLDPNQWTTSITGSAATSLTTSFLVLSTGSVSGNTVSVQSIPTFPRGRWGFVQVGIGILFDSGNVTNVDRFWGLGNLTDGIGFELINNTLRAVVYQAGVLIFSSTLTKPNDGKTHSYIIVSRVDQTYWFMDGFDAPVASAQYLNPNVNTLSINLFMTNTGVPGSAPIFQIMSVGVQTTDDSTSSISDGIYPWIQAKVTPALNLRVDGSTVTQPIKAATGSFTDYSGNASVTSTQFVAANTNRKYLMIFNQSGSINIAVNFGASAVMNAAGSIQIGPKSAFIMDGSWISTQSVNIVSGSGTPPVTVKEGT